MGSVTLLDDEDVAGEHDNGGVTINTLDLLQRLQAFMPRDIVVEQDGKPVSKAHRLGRHHCRLRHW